MFEVEMNLALVSTLAPFYPLSYSSASANAYSTNVSAPSFSRLLATSTSNKIKFGLVVAHCTHCLMSSDDYQILSHPITRKYSNQCTI